MPDEKEKSKPLTKAQEIRKTTKPIMEKRRRARINASLCELKALLLDVMKKEGARTNKMEKADILEMTVKHLRTVQRHQFEAAAVTDPTVFNKYQSGFNECATEVSRYLGTVDGIEAELRSRLLNHLSNCVTSIDSSVHARATPPATAHVRPMQIPQQHNTSMSPPLSVGAIKPTAAVPIMTLPEINNNVLPGMHGLTVAGNTYKTPDMSSHKVSEERLKNADVAAFVIPSNILSGGQMPGYIIPLYSGQAGKLVQTQEGNNNVPASFSLPTVVPVPINLQHSPPQTHAPQSPNTDSKGMDLTTESRYKTDKFSHRVEESALRDERIDIKVPIAVPAQRSVAPAANEPMWRPW